MTRRRGEVRRRPSAKGGWPHRLAERGSVAVELALLLPLLLFIVCGIIDFGRALNAQVTLTQAAREGVRLESLGESNVVSQTEAAATGLSGTTATVVDTCTSSSTTTSNAEVTITYPFTFITPIGALADWFHSGSLGSAMTLTATGVMPCEE